MEEIPVSVTNPHMGALDAALRSALGNASDGLKTGNGTYLIMTGAAQPADIATGQGIAAAHDPVSLSVDRTAIQANGTDTATITIKAPKPGAAPVTLTITITSPSGTITSVDDPITLTNGVGSETITALDPCAITISVKNPANRSTDVLTIIAR